MSKDNQRLPKTAKARLVFPDDWLCQRTRWKVWLLHIMVMGMETGCHRSITEDDVYPESGGQSSGWSAVVFANK